MPRRPGRPSNCRGSNPRLRNGERTMSFPRWLKNLRSTRPSTLVSRRGKNAARSSQFRPLLERLEDRFFLNDTATTETTKIDSNNDGVPEAIYSTTQTV